MFYVLWFFILLICLFYCPFFKNRNYWVKIHDFLQAGFIKFRFLIEFRIEMNDHIQNILIHFYKQGGFYFIFSLLKRIVLPQPNNPKPIILARKLKHNYSLSIFCYYRLLSFLLTEIMLNKGGRVVSCHYYRAKTLHFMRFQCP